MTDIPIKTLVMTAIGQAFTTITSLKSVNRWRNAPVDVDNLSFPCLFFYEIGEVPIPRNRLMMNEIRLIVDVYVDIPSKGYEDFSDDADILQAYIHNAMFSITNKELLKGLVLECQQGPVKKEEANDTIGLLRMEFSITYGHSMGNAFTHVNY
jgi:hypothetical protein